jgi:hypothetical protein
MFLVVLNEYNRQIPKVIEDYICSLNIITRIINMSELAEQFTKYPEEYFILTQMILETSFFTSQLDSPLLSSNRIIFLNVEMLTEEKRFNRMLDIVKYTNFGIADYSIENIHFFNEMLKKTKLPVNNKIIYLPYQFSLKENLVLSNYDDIYEYDIGIINAYVEKSDTVDSSLTYRRNRIWESLQKESDLKIINIMGWNEERDNLIRKCKIILNVHHFECFNIHECIRCDRLVFAKKIIISDNSIYKEKTDTSEYIIYSDYDKLIDKAKSVLENFHIFNTTMKNTFMKSLIESRKKMLQDNLQLILDKKD